MPLGLLSIAANIPERYKLKILDASSLNLSLSETIEEIEKFKPDVLGISAVTYRAWAMVQVLDSTSASIKCVGGPHAKLHAEKIIRQGADAVFIDDSEWTFPKWLSEGCPSGIFDGGQIPLDELPLPKRDIVDLNDYVILHLTKICCLMLVD